MSTDELDINEIRAILVDYQRNPDPTRLGQAITSVERLVSAAGFAGLDRSAQAMLWTLGAAALSFRARSADPVPSDLDRAISWTGNAVAAWPAGDANLPRTRCNLGTLLTDRYERDADPQDLADALTAFEQAVPVMRAEGDRLDVALHSYGCCYHARASEPGGRGVADYDAAIALLTEALSYDSPGPEERAGYLNSLGLSLRGKGRAVGDRAALAESSAVLGKARDLAEAGGETDLSAAINLASVLQDRAEADNDVALLRYSVRIYREVLPALPQANEAQHVRVTTNMATALIDLYRSTRDRQLLDDATRELRANAERIPDGPTGQSVRANLAAALHEMFDYTGRLALLDEAIAVQEHLVAAPNPRPPERTLNLGVCLLARFRRRRSPHDLERAMMLFQETARTTTLAIEKASALNSQANALTLQFDETQVNADIDRCIQLRGAAVAAAPAGSLDRALYQGNLGVDLLKRAELTEDATDLQRAIDIQRHAVQTAPGTWTDQPRLLAGLADSLAREADRSDRAEDLAEARAAYRRAAEIGRQSLPEQALGACMRWGAWEARHDAWPEALAAYKLGLAALEQLVAGQDLRGDKESWIADAQGLPAAGGFASVQARDLKNAVITIERGRGMLLAESLARRGRFTSIHAAT